MTIQELKNESSRRGNTYDNSEQAGRNWSRSWGLTWWRDVWFYKEFRLGNIIYRTGKVRLRHRSYTNTEYRINNQSVSKREFMKALDAFTAPLPTLSEQQHIDSQIAIACQEQARLAAWHRRHPSRSRRLASSDQYVQLSIPFVA